MSATPPAVRNSFAYANDSFYAEASNQSRHRRATVPELRALFRPSTTKQANAAPAKEPVGHWYEAQLLHYGLPPSKTKAVAKTRLLDAVNKGNLSVPPHIVKLEDELKKQWWKAERASKKLQAQTTKSAPAKSPAKSMPAAKATSHVQKASTVTTKKTTAANHSARTAARAPVKAAKQTKAVKKTPAPKETTTQKEPREPTAPKSSEGPKEPRTSKAAQPKKIAQAQGPAKKSAATKSKNGPVPGLPRPSQSSLHIIDSMATTTPISAKQFSRKQTARKTSYNAPPDDSPPPNYAPETFHGKRKYGQSNTTNPEAGSSEAKRQMSSHPREHAMKDYESSEMRDFDSHDPYHYEPYDSYDQDDDQDGSDGTGAGASEDGELGNSEAPNGPLGLLNGTYKVNSQDLDQWSEYDPADFSLTLCLEGREMWGAYDLGMHSGIMHFTERPWQSSTTPIPSTWRGRENGEGITSFEPENEGWIRFMGNGSIEGMINCYGMAQFWGQRISGNATKAPRSSLSMRQEWSEYNTEQYEYENRQRWH